MRVGVIADTHGRLPSTIHEVFRGVTLILHAGDIGGEEVILELEMIARVVAVRGNTDTDLPDARYPLTRRLTLDGVDIFLCHEPFRAAGLDPAPAVIIHGHTHVPHNQVENGTLWFNPGTAGKPQFGNSERTAGILTLEDGRVTGEIIPLG